MQHKNDTVPIKHVRCVIWFRQEGSWDSIVAMCAGNDAWAVVTHPEGGLFAVRV